MTTHTTPRGSARRAPAPPAPVAADTPAAEPVATAEPTAEPVADTPAPVAAEPAPRVSPYAGWLALPADQAADRAALMAARALAEPAAEPVLALVAADVAEHGPLPTATYPAARDRDRLYPAGPATDHRSARACALAAAARALTPRPSWALVSTALGCHTPKYVAAMAARAGREAATEAATA